MTLDELASEIREILRNRARTLDHLGLVAERRAMGPNPGAYWTGGPKIDIHIADASDWSKEARYAVKRHDAEIYLQKLRESPANFDSIVAHLHAWGKKI